MKVFVLSPEKNIPKILFIVSLSVVLVVSVIIISYILVRGKTTLTINGRSINTEVYSDRDIVNVADYFGYKISDLPESKSEITIPMRFNDIYTKYNDLQKKIGFDLYQYKGKKCMKYIYTIKNGTSSDRLLTVLICENRIIGGDISDREYDGECLPLFVS